jgi:TP901 family phage tail tape measure protein
MSALGLQMSDLGTFSDQLAVAAQKSNTNVGQLGEAILTVGGTAKNLAGGTVELATSLGILADKGIKGAEGGTALRNVILSLTAPTDQAAKRMKKLGLNVYDAQGDMRPMNDILNDLNGVMGDMSQKQKPICSTPCSTKPT